MGSGGAALSGLGLMARSGPSTPRTENEELVRLMSRDDPFALSSYRCTAWKVRSDKALGPTKQGKRIKCSDERFVDHKFVGVEGESGWIRSN